MQRIVYGVRALIVCALIASAFVATAQDQTAQAPVAQSEGGSMETGIPLVTIRFNQRSVHFEKALSGAVAQALRAKPDAAFDAVLKPGISSASGEQALGRVVNALRADGVPDARLRALRAAGAGEAYDQVDVFVH